MRLTIICEESFENPDNHRCPYELEDKREDAYEAPGCYTSFNERGKHAFTLAAHAAGGKNQQNVPEAEPEYTLPAVHPSALVMAA